MRTGVTSLTLRAIHEAIIPVLVDTGLQLRPCGGTFMRAFGIREGQAGLRGERLPGHFASLEPDVPIMLMDKITQRLQPMTAPRRARKPKER